MADSTQTEPLLLPALGESVTEGTILRWLVSVGDRIEEGDSLVEVSTDKVDTEIPSPVSGVLTEILIGEDAVVAVGARLATIATSTDASTPSVAPPPMTGSRSTPPSTPSTPSSTVPSAPVAVAPTSGGPRSARPVSTHRTQVVLRLAREHDLDLASIPGTGRDGRVSKRDVLAALERRTVPTLTTAPVEAAPSTTTAPSGGSLPASSSVIEIDLTRALHGAERPVFATVARAVALALRDHAALRGDTASDLVIDVDGPNGATRGLIPSAGDLSLSGLARRIEEITENTSAPGGQLNAFAVIDGTGRETLYDTPQMVDGQLAALCVGPAVRRPVVLSDAQGAEVIAVRSMAYVAMSYDAGRVTSREAAAFLAGVRAHLA